MVESRDIESIQTAVVRICPACGVVNPAGPSDDCPHLQLIRFVGMEPSLEDLLVRLATARVQYQKLLDELRSYVKSSAKNGKAEVIITAKNRFIETAPARKKREPLILANPKPEEHKAPRSKRPKKPPTAKPVDPRQLALIARDPPRGDA